MRYTSFGATAIVAMLLAHDGIKPTAAVVMLGILLLHAVLFVWLELRDIRFSGHRLLRAFGLLVFLGIVGHATVTYAQSLFSGLDEAISTVADDDTFGADDESSSDAAKSVEASVIKTYVNSSPTIVTPTVTPKMTISNSASAAPLNITERSAAPSSPASGDVYLDDGTNTTNKAGPGWRRYTGSAWEDLFGSPSWAKATDSASVQIGTFQNDPGAGNMAAGDEIYNSFIARTTDGVEEIGRINWHIEDIAAGAEGVRYEVHVNHSGTVTKVFEIDGDDSSVLLGGSSAAYDLQLQGAATHGFSTLLGTASFFRLSANSGASGAVIRGASKSSGETGLWLQGLSNQATGAAVSTVPTLFRSSKRSGTGAAALEANEPAFAFQNNTTNILTLDAEGDTQFAGKIGLSAVGTKLTVATGVITISKSFHDVDGEGDAADDLVTINGGTEGDVLYLRADDDAVTITVKDGTDNIQCAGDFALDNLQDVIHFIFDGTNWLEVSRSDNGA